MENLHLLFESSIDNDLEVTPKTPPENINPPIEKTSVNQSPPRAIVPQQYYALTFNPLGYPCRQHEHPASCRYFCWDINTWPKDKNTHRGLLSANLRMPGCLCSHCYKQVGNRPGLN